MKVLYQIILTFVLISSARPADELGINVTYIPPECPVTSKNGDILSTDYTGWLENGTVFDTRYMNKRHAMLFL